MGRVKDLLPEPCPAAEMARVEPCFDITPGELRLAARCLRMHARIFCDGASETGLRLRGLVLDRAADYLDQEARGVTRARYAPPLGEPF